MRCLVAADNDPSIWDAYVKCPSSADPRALCMDKEISGVAPHFGKQK